MNNKGGILGSGGSIDLTTEQIKAHGEVKTRIGVLWFVGIICAILSLGGVAAFFVNPQNAKDIWVIIGPIISAGVSGIVSYSAGENSAR
jgi:hypothetical protein